MNDNQTVTRKFFTVIRHEDPDGLKEICLVLDDDNLIQSLQTLTKLINIEIEHLKSERLVTTTRECE